MLDVVTIVIAAIAIMVSMYAIAVSRDAKRKYQLRAKGPYQCLALTKAGERCNVGLDENGLCGIHGRSRKTAGDGT